MIPLEVTLEEYRSYRSLHLVLPRRAVWYGPVGAGKSAVQESLRWVLYGETDSTDSRGQVRIGADHIRGEWIWQAMDGQVYRAIRAQSFKTATPKSDLQLALKNGDGWIPLTGKTIRETQAKIREILGLDYDAMTSGAISPQGLSAKFCRPPKIVIDGRAVEGRAARMAILAQAEHLEGWEVWRKAAAGEAREFDQRAVVLEAQVAEADQELSNTLVIQGPGGPGVIDGALLGQPATKMEVITLELSAFEQTIHSARQTAQEAQGLIEALTGQLATLQAEIEAGRRQTASLAAEEKALADLEASQIGKEATLTRYRGILEHRAEIEAKAVESETLTKQADAIRVELAGIEAEIRGLEGQKAPAEGRLKAAREKLASIQGRTAEIQRRLASRGDLARKLDRLKAARVEWDTVADSIHATDEQACTTRAQRDAITAANTTAQEERGRILAEEKRVQAQASGLLPQIQGCERRTAVLGDVPCIGIEDHHGRLIAQRCPLIADAVEAQKALPEIQAQYLRVSTWKRPTLPDIQPTDELDTTLRTLMAAKAQQQGRLAALDQEIRTLTPAEAELAALDMIAGEVPRLEAEERTSTGEVDGLIQEVTRLEIEAAAHRGGMLTKRTELGTVNEQVQALARWVSLLPEIGLAEREVPSIETDLRQLSDQMMDLAARIDEAAMVQTALTYKGKTLAASRGELEAQRTKGGRARAEEQVATDAAAKHRATLASLEKLAGEREAAAKEAADLRAKHSVLAALTMAYKQIPVMVMETQAIPEIAEQANRVLAMISKNHMRIELTTQRELKTRDELADGVDIWVTDDRGRRTYENYSGGQRMQLDIALRVGQVKRQARRTGAGIGCLWLDEGLGTQNAADLPMVREAFRVVAREFPSVHIITHVEGLRETFESCVEVRETVNGSVAEVVGY